MLDNFLILFLFSDLQKRKLTNKDQRNYCKLENVYGLTLTNGFTSKREVIYFETLQMGKFSFVRIKCVLIKIH